MPSSLLHRSIPSTVCSSHPVMYRFSSSPHQVKGPCVGSVPGTGQHLLSAGFLPALAHFASCSRTLLWFSSHAASAHTRILLPLLGGLFLCSLSVPQVRGVPPGALSVCLVCICFLLSVAVCCPPRGLGNQLHFIQPGGLCSHILLTD